MTRRILVVAHPDRSGTGEAVATAVRELEAHGVETVVEFDPNASDAVDAALVLGGDGTMLHAADLTRGFDIPLLGVNFGGVGFLAELESDGLQEAAVCLAENTYSIEERGTLEWVVNPPTGVASHGWALNELTVERSDPRRTLEVEIEVDGMPLSTFGCDGVVMSTATGSTAHAFSAGGPVMWPNVDALLMVPLAAHALFARPIVVGPESWFAVEIAADSSSAGLAVADGARSVDAPLGSRIEVRRSAHKVLLARKTDSTFAERLITKFDLPTEGWRGERGHGSAGA